MCSEALSAGAAPGEWRHVHVLAVVGLVSAQVGEGLLGGGGAAAAEGAGGSAWTQLGGPLSLRAARRVLDKQHYGLDKAKDRCVFFCRGACVLSFTSGGAISGKQMIISQTAFLRTRHGCVEEEPRCVADGAGARLHPSASGMRLGYPGQLLGHEK